MIPTVELDRLVALLLTGLATDSHDAERLIRMGACGEKSTLRALGRLASGPKAVRSALAREALPPPQALVSWGRLLAAMYAWKTRAGTKRQRVSLERVAYAEDWGGQSTLSTSFRRYTGVYPRVWLTQGADMEALVGLLLKRWRARQPQRARRDRQRKLEAVA